MLPVIWSGPAAAGIAESASRRASTPGLGRIILTSEGLHQVYATAGGRVYLLKDPNRDFEAYLWGDLLLALRGDPVPHEIHILGNRHHVEVFVVEALCLPGIIEVGCKVSELVPDARCACRPAQTYGLHEPVPHRPHYLVGLVLVALDVDTGHVRERLHEVIPLFFQDETGFRAQVRCAETAGAVVDPKLEGHVQPVEFVCSSSFQSREIVNAVL